MLEPADAHSQDGSLLAAGRPSESPVQMELILRHPPLSQTPSMVNVTASSISPSRAVLRLLNVANGGQNTTRSDTCAAVRARTTGISAGSCKRR
jgi:hypothetical protein